tara:strand:+ start:18832 stop:19023 length:192 start_codon:yes stop_codon:yes gene_type:complete
MIITPWRDPGVCHHVSFEPQLLQILISRTLPPVAMILLVETRDQPQIKKINYVKKEGGGIFIK